MSNITHGLRSHPAYKRYQHILGRCYNPNDKAYHNYGGRGIVIEHAPWGVVEGHAGLIAFCKWWDAQPGTDEDKCRLMIERDDNNRGYSPDNCHLDTRTVQNRNQRRNIRVRYKGQSRLLTEVYDDLVLRGRDPAVSCQAARHRYQQLGWSLRDALFTPPLTRDSRIMYHGKLKKFQDIYDDLKTHGKIPDGLRYKVAYQRYFMQEWPIRDAFFKEPDRRNGSEARRITIKDGERFGRLVIIQELDKVDGRRMFMCICDCGKSKIAQLKLLRDGRVKSCGCLHKDMLRERHAKARLERGV